MTPEQYLKAGDLYHAALDLPADQRDAFLRDACGGDATLLAEVASLLTAHASAGAFVAEPHADLEGLRAALPPPVPSAAMHVDVGAAGDLLERHFEPGQRLGRYEIVDLLGAGGMGRVYRARDPVLGREVAIKALARRFDRDAASLRRFEREARVLATLNHANVAAIYGFEQIDGLPYLVLERVEGITLAERLRRGAMSPADAIAAAVQIAAGLEGVHAKGLVHRDLKPSNVMLSPDGPVKLVDFGLARTADGHGVSADPNGSITHTGMVLGTARYMSPEQVRGDIVDSRTDVWAFGCVLFEMLTARPAFAGESVSEVVAAVLRDEPAWHALPVRLSPRLRRLLRRCLRRDPHERLQHIGDARLELVDADGDEELERTSPAAAASGRWWMAAAAALIAVVGAGLLLALRPSPSGSAPVTARFSLELPGPLAFGSEFSPPFAIAPRGAPIVVEAGDGGTPRLYVRDLNDPALRALFGTEGARQPFFSPDGAWVGFFSNLKLAKVPTAGGPVLQLADIGGNPRGATWLPNGTIVVAPSQTSGLVQVPDGGGKPVALTTVDNARGEATHRWPDALPGGAWVLFTVGLEDALFDDARIEAVSPTTGERRLVLAGAGFARFLPPNRLLFVRGGRLHAVGFDPTSLSIDGKPEVMVDGVRYDWRNGGAHLATSAGGPFIYTPGAPSSTEHLLAWTDASGTVTPITDTPRAFRDIKASPDGRRIAAVIGSSAGSDLWMVESNGTLSQVSFGLAPHRPTWTSRGDAITFGVEANGRWRLLTLPADGRTTEPTVLLESAGRLYPNAWSPDGRRLVFQEFRPETGWDLQLLEVDANGRPAEPPRPLASTPFHESNASISHDGHWFAYESDELDGIVQVYVRSFPDGVHKQRVSSSGARSPAWDTSGRLYFWQTGDNNLDVVSTREVGGELQLSAAQLIWNPKTVAPALLKRIVVPVAGVRYDVDPGGERYLVLDSVVRPTPPQLASPVVVFEAGSAPTAARP